MSDTLIRQMLAALPLPALIVERSERILAANDAATALLGARLEGRHFATVLRQPPVAEAIESCLRDGTPGQARHHSGEGTRETLFDVACRPLPGVGAQGAGAVLVSFLDVTGQEQAEQMRRDFVANVSHELRTPLTALIGFIETLRGAARDDAAGRERFLGIMAGEATRMNRLVGDLLSLSRVEAQERVRPAERVDLGALLASTLKSLAPLAAEVSVRLILDAPEGPVTVTGDPDQLRQVFTNLIENAIKYGKSGGVVDVVLRAVDRDVAIRGPGARVQVIDRGPGIDPVHLPRLTERFYRVDSHRSRQLGGTGLGLAIVKHIVSRHRGRLKVESAPGQGATFTVILPA